MTKNSVISTCEIKKKFLKFSISDYQKNPPKWSWRKDIIQAIWCMKGFNGIQDSRDDFISISSCQPVDWQTGEVQIKSVLCSLSEKIGKTAGLKRFQCHWLNSFKMNYCINHYGQIPYSILGNGFFITSHLKKKTAKNLWDFQNVCKTSMLEYSNKFGSHYFNCNIKITSHSTQNTKSINSATSSEIHLHSLRILQLLLFQSSNNL